MLRRLLLCAALAGAGTAEATVFDIDAAHSTVGFKVTHLAITKVRGQFNDFSGTFEFDPKAPEKGATNAVIKSASIDTGIEKRDDHLRSADFFEVEKYPTIEFKSTSIDKVGGRLTLRGELTMHGVTKPVSLELEHTGMASDPWGAGLRAGFSARGVISRYEFGLKWNQVLEAGKVVVGEFVELELDIQGVEKKEQPAKKAGAQKQ